MVPAVFGFKRPQATSEIINWLSPFRESSRVLAKYSGSLGIYCLRSSSPTMYHVFWSLDWGLDLAPTPAQNYTLTRPPSHLHFTIVHACSGFQPDSAASSNIFEHQKPWDLTEPPQRKCNKLHLCTGVRIKM